ncbi:DUF4249 domain-containing protein [Tenacibaculum sp. MEBiC06402]|uniref:DUF4249 domain-containing protein n=1 Tax=unclassified Tenacibaculum TaxID=2635139 RepID=UPI003B9B2D9C
MKKLKKISYLFLAFLASSCIESVELTNNSFESNLVVKAIITNEIKNHTVELSRTTPIDSDEIISERNATVSVTDDSGIIYSFQETGNGIYTSTQTFAAQPSKKYTLNIQTSDGEKYSSKEEQLPNIGEINDITANIDTNIDDESIIAFKVNASGNNIDGSYYRYEYDETYKIKAFIWNSKRIRVLSDVSPYDFDLVDKEPEIYGEGFCYGRNKSNNLMITETKTLAQDQVQGFPIREIPLESYIVGVRYSILLTQYILNQNTYDYYQLLDKFSGPNDIFSQTQVGNIPSNIKSESNSSENNVIGFFEVSSVNKKRFFFNRSDITDITYKNYTDSNACNEFPKPLFEDDFGNSPLLEFLETHIFYNEPPGGIGGSSNSPYEVVLRQCGDCSHLGPVQKPDFWVD